MHDVHEGIPHSDFPASDPLDRKHQLFFVIKCGKAFIAIQCQFVLSAYFPRCNRNPAAFFRLNRQIRAGLASLKKQFIIGISEVPMIRAEGQRIRICRCLSCCHKQCSIFFHFGIRPFRRDYPSTTLRPPKRFIRWQEANSFKQLPVRV